MAQLYAFIHTISYYILFTIIYLFTIYYCQNGKLKASLQYKRFGHVFFIFFIFLKLVHLSEQKHIHFNQCWPLVPIFSYIRA